MKHVITQGNIPVCLASLAPLLNEFCKYIEIDGLDTQLMVEFEDGFAFPARPQQVLIHALIATDLTTPAEVRKQANEISARMVMISTDFTKVDISYKSKSSSFGENNTPVSDFYDRVRLHLTKQIVDFIFLDKHPYTDHPPEKLEVE